MSRCVFFLLINHVSSFHVNVQNVKCIDIKYWVKPMISCPGYLKTGVIQGGVHVNGMIWVDIDFSIKNQDSVCEHEYRR